jgi:hypothetical protein
VLCVMMYLVVLCGKVSYPFLSHLFVLSFCYSMDYTTDYYLLNARACVFVCVRVYFTMFLCLYLFTSVHVCKHVQILM